MSRRTFLFTAEIEIQDESTLRRAAAEQAREDGLSDEDWEDMRDGLSDDILMLLDPGAMHGAGIEIGHSQCEEI